jgi:D-glycero-alpha-D-manno-heptose-7-phosphate kinase
MIISRTPFRISFAGGGTDLPAFTRQEPGAVTATTVDKYMFITVNKRFDETLRVSYSKTEIVDGADDLRHPIVREALKLVGLTRGLEITSIADLPAGTGMGSSSAFTVGLLNALYAYKGQHTSAEDLAEAACRIEIELLGEPIGKQDQYAAACGGLNHIRFNPDGSVFVDPVITTREVREELDANLLLFYTGATRSASAILKRQQDETDRKRQVLRGLRDIAERMARALQNGRRLNDFGDLLHEAWQLKRRVADGITSPDIDRWYEAARGAGALGGKVLGAGGGGFLLFFVERQNQGAVRRALADLRELPFRLEPQGSKIIYVGG